MTSLAHLQTKNDKTYSIEPQVFCHFDLQACKFVNAERCINPGIEIHKRSKA